MTGAEHVRAHTQGGKMLTGRIGQSEAWFESLASKKILIAMLSASCDRSRSPQS
jgi:hypothetical protein